jgi:hypothetical protein
MPVKMLDGPFFIGPSSKPKKRGEHPKIIRIKIIEMPSANPFSFGISLFIFSIR